MWKHWDMICTKRSKTGSWKNNLATKLVSPSLSLSLGLSEWSPCNHQAMESRLFREEERGSQRFGLVDQVMM